MRKAFSETLEKISSRNKKIIFLTGDLGFMALEGIRDAIGERFINAGVSEQNMITMAAALASEGFTSICYSIAPFTVFRPAEQIRLDVCLHNMNVKIIGNGGGYGYGIMGSTHHAIEDIGVLSTFQNMRCYIPFCREDVGEITESMMNHKGPGYLRLAAGEKPEGLTIPDYSHTRRLLKGNKVTIVTLGTVTLNTITAIKSFEDKSLADLFVVSEIPVPDLSKQLENSVKKTGKLLIVEEHVQRGGLGENLSELILSRGISCRYRHLFALGYPNGLYGSQQYHQALCSLDPKSVEKNIKELLK